MYLLEDYNSLPGESKALTFHSICAALAERTSSLTCLWGGEKGQSVVLLWRRTHFDNIWQMFVTLASLVCRWWSCLYQWWQISAPLLLFAGLCFAYDNRTSSRDENQLLWSEQRDGRESDPGVNHEVHFDFVTFLCHYFQRVTFYAINVYPWL